MTDQILALFFSYFQVNTSLFRLLKLRRFSDPEIRSILWTTKSIIDCLPQEALVLRSVT